MFGLPTPEKIAFVSVVVVYFAAAIVGILQLLAGGDKYKRFLLPLVSLAVTLEAVILIFRAVAIKAVPLTGLFESMIVEITRESKDGMIEIWVSDTGIGMSPEVCRRAFESFFTTKEISKGTGLGLFISYNLVAEVDGTIAMESELGKGTTVIVRIPIRPKKHLIASENREKDFFGSAKVVNKRND